MATRTFVSWVAPIAAQLRDNRTRVVEFARSLPADVWSKPSPLEGWSYKDLLAHIGKGNDQILQKLLGTVAAGDRVDVSIFSVDTNEANAREVAARRDRSVDEVIAELEEAGDEIQELLSQLSDRDEHLRQEEPPFILKGFLQAVQKESHDLEHLAQLRTALEA